MSHFRSECKHGILYSQCRCPGPTKRVDIVPCEDVGCQQTKKSVVPDSEIKRIASAIIEAHTEDIEWLSLAEMTSNMLEAAEWPIDTVDEEEEIWNRVDKMLKKAVITITFED